MVLAAGQHKLQMTRLDRSLSTVTSIVTRNIVESLWLMNFIHELTKRRRMCMASLEASEDFVMVSILNCVAIKEGEAEESLSKEC